MKLNHSLKATLLSCLCLYHFGYSQENELGLSQSSEVFLEAYSDEFQGTFFEALKQKGIENYDRAINLLLKCKELNPDNIVVDAELARAYYNSEQYIAAQEYAITALNAQPDNIWFLSLLVDIAKKQGGTIDGFLSQIPKDNDKLKENLASIYFKQKKYIKALNILKGINKSEYTLQLTAKIDKAIAKANKKMIIAKDVTKKKVIAVNPLEAIRIEIDTLIQDANYIELEKLSSEALESYPSQPYFYYANGLALNKTGKAKEAIEVLQTALDYMLDDTELTNKIYLELANAYTALGEASKANMYLSKIKSGL